MLCSSEPVRWRTTTSWAESYVPVAVTVRKVSSRGTVRPGAVSLSTGTAGAPRLFPISWFCATLASWRCSCQKPSLIMVGISASPISVRITHCRVNRKRYTSLTLLGVDCPPATGGTGRQSTHPGRTQTWSTMPSFPSAREQWAPQ